MTVSSADEAGSHLNIQFIVDLESTAEEVDVLDEIGELPCIPNASKHVGR